MNLNIIGNGFDLYHGLPSSYYYFGCYLIKEQPDLYETIGNMYGFTFRKVHRTYPDDLYLENDDPIDIDMEDDIVAERLKMAFIQWVNDTLDRDENY